MSRKEAKAAAKKRAAAAQSSFLTQMLDAPLVRPDAPVLTQQKIADALGISRGQVSKLLSGERLLSQELEPGMAKLLGVTVQTLRDGLKPARAPLADDDGSDPRFFRHGDGFRQPQGLPEFLLRRAVELKITRRERYVLESMTFSLEHWIKVDDRFWERCLAFWRDFLKEADARPADDDPPTPADGPF